MHTFSSTKKKGFALLFAVLASSVFLAVGATIVSATIKNLIFSTSGRESQFAFYAADSGAECALYFDKVGEIFPTVNNPDLPEPFICHGQEVSEEAGNIVVEEDADPRIRHTTFTLKGLDAAGAIDLQAPCSSVTVTKLYDAPDYRTQVYSHGYNTCNETSIRRLERVLRVQY